MPTAMSNVSASSGSEIALFSGVSDSDGLSISGNGDTANMELKATNENGKTKKASDFQMNADNVLYIKIGDKVTVNDNVDFTKAIATDGNNNQKAIGITSNGVIDFTGYPQGLSTLDVVVDDDRAYEAIIVIGQQPPEVINKQVTKVNNNQESNIRFEFLLPDPGCPEGYVIDDEGHCVPEEPVPCDEGEELIDGKCQPVPVPCDEGFERQGDECIPIDDTCMGGPQGLDGCPPLPEPEPVECSEAGYMRQGNECVVVDCEQYEGNPCNDLIQPGNPNAAEEIIPVDEEVPTEGIDCELQPELCEENIVEIPNIPLEETEEEELPEEEELTETTEIEEIEEEEVEEESGESEGSEDSGGGEDEGSEDSGGN